MNRRSGAASPSVEGALPRPSALAAWATAGAAPGLFLVWSYLLIRGQMLYPSR